MSDIVGQWVNGGGDDFFLLLGLVKKHVSYAAVSFRKKSSSYHVINQASKTLLAHNDILCKKIKDLKLRINATAKQKYEKRKYRLLGKPKNLRSSFNRH